MIYIKFEIPKNIKGHKSENKIKLLAVKGFKLVLSKIIPIANPDFENKFDLVKYWLVEFENENEIPIREIGINEENKVILKMPYLKNYGYWTDNHLLINDFKNHFNVTEITKEIFEQNWKSFP